MRDTLYRQWSMLRLLPRYPQKITAGELYSRLGAAGGSAEISRRTLERDLQELSRIFPIEQTDLQTKPTAWRWRRGARVFDIPGLDLPSALSFHLVEAYLHKLLPASTLADLQPWFATAAGVLRKTPGRLGRWPDKVRVLSRGQPLLAPKIDPEVQRVIYEALLNEQRLAITYAVKGQAANRDLGDVNPLALVVKDQLVYLICTMWDYTDIRQLVLHRMRAARATDQRATPIAGFDLDAYIHGGEFGVVVGRAIRLEVLFERHAAAHLAETPLADDQILTDIGTERVRVRATVPDNQELRWWLLAFGAQVEVIRPKALRKVLATEAARMARRYRQPTNRR